MTDQELKALGVPRKARRALRFTQQGRQMAKLDPFLLPRPERPTETRSFTEGEATLTLTLRPPDAADIARASEASERLVQDYITGSEDRAAGDFPEGVKVSKTLFMTCALIGEMQCPENPADAYTVLELVLLSDRLPRAWKQLQAWVNDLTGAWRARAE